MKHLLAKMQQAIIETTVALLVERRGGDVQIDEIASKMRISERTIFRFFGDKKTLHQAVDQYLTSYLQASAQQMASLSFVGFGKNAYQLFDKHEHLTLAYLYSPFGQETRRLFRKKLNDAMIAKITAEKSLNLTPERMKRLALITSLVNAKIWHDIKADYQFSGEDMGDTVAWALNTLIENC